MNESDSEMRRAPAPVRWDDVRKVHVMGICGSAMGAFAGMLQRRGYIVKGSDTGAYPPVSTALEALGIEVMEGYSEANLDWAPDVVVVGNVIRPTYPEAVALRARGIAHTSLPTALADLFIADRTSVVITGTHGKTTTTSMTAWILERAGLAPGFMVGGITGNFGSNHRVTDGPIFVVEGDEYDTAYFDKGPKFFHYRPRFASINNIEFDHADIYRDVDAIVEVFSRFATLLPADGRLVVNAGDANALHAASHTAAGIWRFAIDAPADIRASGLHADADGTTFRLALPGQPATEVRLPLWGRYNVDNALTAAGLAYAAGASLAAIVDGLATFRPPKKRFELRGVAANIPVIDDFAHHPTAIAATLGAVRARYPDRRVVALFEVQSNTARRRVFQDGFAKALATADRVYFCKPLEKASDALPPEQRLSMSELVSAIRKAGTEATVIEEVDALAAAVVADADPGGDVIIAMSGRNFHGIYDRLLEGLRGAHGE